MAMGYILLKTSSTFVRNTIFDYFNYYPIRLTSYSLATLVLSNYISIILKRKYDVRYSLVQRRYQRPTSFPSSSDSLIKPLLQSYTKVLSKRPG
jgi:hypothetical protein